MPAIIFTCTDSAKRRAVGRRNGGSGRGNRGDGAAARQTAPVAEPPEAPEEAAPEHPLDLAPDPPPAGPRAPIGPQQGVLATIDIGTTRTSAEGASSDKTPASGRTNSAGQKCPASRSVFAESYPGGCLDALALRPGQSKHQSRYKTGDAGSLHPEEMALRLVEPEVMAVKAGAGTFAILALEAAAREPQPPQDEEIAISGLITGVDNWGLTVSVFDITMLMRLAAADKRAQARAYEDYIKTIASGICCTTTRDSGRTNNVMRMTTGHEAELAAEVEGA
eukprot:jgi/Tetstr1/461411/TSEL_006521.t1